MKRIVIIANFVDKSFVDNNSRFVYLSRLLSAHNDVELITSSFDHNTKTQKQKSTDNEQFRTSLIKECGYPRNICLKRFASHMLWGLNVARYVKKIENIDVIYCAVPSLTAAFLASRISKKKNIKFVIDIQDLWPEAFEMVFNVPIIKTIVFFPFRVLVDSIYKSADEVFAVSETYAKRANINNSQIQPHSVFLGTELEKFDEYAFNSNLKRGNRNFIIGYCGSLSNSYDLITVIDAISHATDEEETNIEFFVMGDGQRRQEFEDYANKKGIIARFFGRLPYPDMCRMLVQCDIVVNPISKNSAASIVNKVGDYAAAGKPVINTQDSNEYRELIEEYHMGINCDNGNSDMMTRAILTLLRDSRLRDEMSKNARRCAEERFDRGHTYDKIVTVLQS